MISSHRIQPIAILCIFIDEENNKKWHRKEDVQSKKWCPWHKFFYVLFCVTQTFLVGFSWSSDNITASNKKNTSRKEPTTVSEITIYYLHRNIIIPLLRQCGLFIHTCVSKNSVVSKDIIFYLFWYNAIRWNSHICKKSSFLSFHSFLYLVNNTGEVIE